MTAAVPDPTVESHIAEVLGEHFVMWHDMPQSKIAGEWRCQCGLKFGFSDSAIAHLAAVLAPVVAAEVERAVEKAAVRAVRLTETVRATSRAISGTYPADIDPEAHMWRRCTKVTEEAGEVTEALLGLVGENPRKGQTHDTSEVVAELLDTANAALGAVDHLLPDSDPVALLVEHSQAKWDRLRAALDGGRP